MIFKILLLILFYLYFGVFFGGYIDLLGFRKIILKRELGLEFVRI